MLQFFPEEVPDRANHRLLTGVLVPRPVAWITSLAANGNVNVAPFSAFTLVCPSPPMIGFSVGPKKDTARHVEARREFVVNIPSFTDVDALHETSFEYAPEVSEVEELGLAVAPSVRVSTPRLACAPVQMECVVREIYRHGNFATRFVVGEIVAFHVADELLSAGPGSADYTVDVSRLDPICVLAGGQYARVGPITQKSPLHGSRNPWGVSYPERQSGGVTAIDDAGPSAP